MIVLPTVVVKDDAVVRFETVPVVTAVVGALARAWLRVAWALLIRVVSDVMPELAASSVLLAFVIPVSNRFCIAFALLRNAFDKKKFVALSSAELTFLPVARRVCAPVMRSVVCWSARRFERTPAERMMSGIVVTFLVGLPYWRLRMSIASSEPGSCHDLL